MSHDLTLTPSAGPWAGWVAALALLVRIHDPSLSGAGARTTNGGDGNAATVRGNAKARTLDGRRGARKLMRERRKGGSALVDLDRPLGDGLDRTRFVERVRLDRADGRGDADDDVVVVRVVEEPAEPGLVGRARLRQRHQAGR